MNVLCLSRSYLSRLLPTLQEKLGEIKLLHITQTSAEADWIRRNGGTVVLDLEALMRERLPAREAPLWSEPEDFRSVTGFEWSPIYADRYLPEFAPVLRERIAGVLDEAVQKLFETHKFDAFLSEPVALFVAHLLFYYSRKANVRPLLWANAYFPGFFYFADEIDIARPARRAPVEEGWAAEVRERVTAYASGVVEDRAGPVNHPAFLKRAQSRLTYFRQRRGQASLVLRPGLWTQLLQLGRLARATAKRVYFPRSGDFLTAGAVAEHAFYLRALRTPARVYDEPPPADDPSAVVFPLQFEPEATLLYLAPDFVDQCALAEACARSLPHGHTLYVKEHPNQFGALGEARWQRLRKRYANIRFIHGRQSGRVLMRRAGLVVAITSTAGMDGLLLGKRVLVAGRVYYQSFTGAKRIGSYQELAHHLNDPDNYRPTGSFDANVEELARFGEQCYAGDPQPSLTLFTEQGLQQLAYAVRSELQAEA